MAWFTGETGRSMNDGIKEHDGDIRLARTQTYAVSEHAHKTDHYPLWNEVKFGRGNVMVYVKSGE